MLRRLEKLLAILLIGLSLFHAGRMAVAMATTSLSTDEFGTVGSFSAKGPLAVMTDYRAPKNHVFFNLLNSLLPGRESLAPSRVRALSILATALTALLLIGYAAARGRWLEGALLLALWSAAPQMLRLSMEARGYGFLGLFAVLAAIAVIEYFRGRERRWLWTLGIAAALGVYTVPGFLFFAGPLMLALWLVERSRATFLAGAFTAAAILALYSPLLVQVFSAFTSFHQDKAEADFETAHGLARAMKLYFLQTDDWAAWALLGGMALAPFIFATDRRESPALRLLAGTCLIYFAVLLALRTPPVRMAAFSLLPLGIAGAWSTGSWMRNRLPQIPRALLGACAALFMLCVLIGVTRSFQFVPTENWSLAARAIDTAFPAGIHVEFRRYAKYLRQTLPDSESRSADYDPAAFADGRLVVADAGNKWAEGDRFVAPKNIPRGVRWIIPGSIRDIVLNFCLPIDPGLDLPASLADGRANTSVRLSPNVLELRGRAGNGAKALIVLLNRPAAPDELQVDASNHRHSVLFAGNAIVLPLEPDPPVDVRLRTAPGSDLEAVEAWITR